MSSNASGSMCSFRFEVNCGGIIGEELVTTPISNLQFDCDSCRLGKSKTLPFPTHTPNIVQHGDVWGMTPIISHANYKYVVTFIDDYSCFTWIYFLHSKDKVLSMFKIFHAYSPT